MYVPNFLLSNNVGMTWDKHLKSLIESNGIIQIMPLNIDVTKMNMYESQSVKNYIYEEIVKI